MFANIATHGESLTFGGDMRIYLIGFMGSGKSSLGREVASRFHVPFMDTDALVEEREGMSVRDVFTEKGEYYFRDVESDVLRQTSQVPKAIIATGGGLPCFHDNMDWISLHGISVYLEWSLEELKSQLLQERSDRPLLAAGAEEDAWHRAQNLFFERKPIYERAAITIGMEADFQENLRKVEKACSYIW